MFKDFPISEDEYSQLNKKFDNLCHYASWQLLRKNIKNNHTLDEEDVVQELRMVLLVAGSYYKRQVYIEACFDICDNYIKDKFVKNMFKELIKLWKNKTRHGANKQKFGPHQEKILENILNKFVPINKQPDKNAPLLMDEKFIIYCKRIVWNAQGHIGKKITKEKSIRTGQVSLSEYDYLSSPDVNLVD